MTKAEIIQGNMQVGHDIQCPECGSSSVHVDKKGFSGDNACCGWLLCGPIGALCGTMGSSKLVGTCMKCGKKFDVESQIKKHWERRL